MADPALKRTTFTKILWLDLEMSGLDPQLDRILEVGAIVTDWDFTELASFESGVGQELAEIRPRLAANADFYTAFPQLKAEMLQLAEHSPPEQTVVADLLKMLDSQFASGEPILLAGNSIHMDRQFIRHWWPEVEARLHYRMLDVSAWKVVMQGKYGAEFTKDEAHRALGDIRESIAELQYYLDLAKF